MIRLVCLLLGGLAGAAPAVASDGALLRALGGLPAVESAAEGARSGSPEAVQRLYDRARDVAEDLRVAAPVSGSCLPLWRAAVATMQGHVRAAEGVDRLSPAAAARGRSDAAAARRRLERTRGGCRPAAAAGDATPPPLITPRPGEAFFGGLRARVPPGAFAAELLVDGIGAGAVRVDGAEVRFRSAVPIGRHDISIVFRDENDTTVGSATSAGTWALPESGRAAAGGTTRDANLAQRLEQPGASFPGYSGIWVQDLVSGKVAGRNADARFPAASTVKLALLIGVLAQQGPTPESSRLAYDLRAMAGWSSNLATNRILARAGGSSVAQRVMERIGATGSTFTGGYIVGTELQPGLPAGGRTAEPPATSSRVTTARDMGRLLFALHAAATGRADALATTGLTLHQARVGLAMLLESEQKADNRSLVAGGVPAGTPIAQKNGWLRRARHGASIIYGPDGPHIVVVLTYAGGGVTWEQAAGLGSTVARISDPRQR